jgi:hypothetical protein
MKRAVTAAVKELFYHGRNPGHGKAEAVVVML